VGNKYAQPKVYNLRLDTNSAQIQQLDFVSERKRWEAEKARQAPPEDDAMVEEVVEDAPLPEWTSHIPQPTQELTEADYVAAQEEYELQQLVAAMEQQDQENDAASQHFGSDDDDYDQLFMDCSTMINQDYQQQPQPSSYCFAETDAMDMDMTDG
jgi:hypothetical protein